jgi:hypothetical protein
MNKANICSKCNLYEPILKHIIITYLSPLKVEINTVNIILLYLPICNSNIHILHFTTCNIPHYICYDCMKKYTNMIGVYDSNVIICPIHNCNRLIFI